VGQVFKNHDADKDGIVHLQEIKDAFKEIGLNQEEIDKIMINAPPQAKLRLDQMK
jgi:Ca2+-binding EF-hand superfamily protein